MAGENDPPLLTYLLCMRTAKIEAGKPERGWVLIAVSGHLDARGSSALEKACRARLDPGVKLAVDLSEVTFMSSEGLRVLLTTFKAVSRANGTMSLVSPGGAVLETLRISAFTQLFSVVKSTEELE